MDEVFFECVSFLALYLYKKHCQKVRTNVILVLELFDPIYKFYEVITGPRCQLTQKIETEKKQFSINNISFSDRFEGACRSS